MAMIRVRVTPGAQESAVGDWRDGVLRVKVREKPQKGRATDAVGRLLAEALGVAPSAVVLVRGATSREKAFAVEGLDLEEIKRRLGGPML